MTSIAALSLPLTAFAVVGGASPAGASTGHPAVAQAGPNPPSLVAPATAVVGESVTFTLEGTTPLPPVPELLLLDFELAPTPAVIEPYGVLELALGPGLQVLPGDGTSTWTVPIPDDPGLIGLELHGQGLGLVYADFIGELLLSDRTSVELTAEPPAAVRLAAVASLGAGTVGFHAVDSEGDTTRHFGLATPGGSLRALDAAPDGNHLYAVDQVAGRLTTLDVDPEEGGWNLGPSVGIDPGTLDVLVEPEGRFLYTASTTVGRIQRFLLAANGDPVALPTPPPSDFRPTALAADPDGRTLFAAAPLSGLVRAEAIDPTTGDLTESDVLPVAGGPARLAVGGGGARLHVLSPSVGLLTTWAFDPASGLFGAAVGAPVATGGAVDLALDPTGRFLYLLDSAGASLRWHAVEPSTGVVAPTPTGTVPTAAGGLRLAIDGRAERLFVTGLAEHELWVHAPDPDTGEPVFLQALRQRSTPVDVALLGGNEPTQIRSRVLLAGYSESAEVRPKQLDLAAGQVFDLGLSAPTDVDGPRELALDRRTGALLSAQALGGVSAFVFNVQNINVTGTADVAPGTGPGDVAIEPGGRFAWSVEPGADRLRAFELVAGVPLELGLFDLPISRDPVAAAVSPEGGWLAVAAFASRTLEVLAIDADGGLTAVGAAPLDGVPVDVTFDPSGRRALVATRGPDRLVALELDPTSGAPGAVSSANVGLGALAVAASPTGREVFVANAGGKSITALRLDPDTGALTVVEQQGLAEAPTGLAVDASGRYLVVAVGSIDLFQQFAVDPLTGALDGIGLSAAVGGGPDSLVVSVELD